MMRLKGRWVLVTGASSGLGWAMAELLASEHGANLVLVARRQDRLQELREKLVKDHQISVEVVVADLSDLEQVDRVFDVATDGRDIDAVILNAGITHFGRHDELDWAGFERMLAVNVTATVRLTSKFVPYLTGRGVSGAILLVSSLAGVLPVPYQTVYSGTKAFLVNYGCGLYHELRHTDVSVTTFVPGGIRTEMTAGEKFGPLRPWLMPVDRCARDAINAMCARRFMFTPGVGTRVGTALLNLLPRRFVTGRLAATYRAALEKAAS